MKRFFYGLILGLLLGGVAIFLEVLKLLMKSETVMATIKNTLTEIITAFIDRAMYGKEVAERRRQMGRTRISYYPYQGPTKRKTG